MILAVFLIGAAQEPQAFASAKVEFLTSDPTVSTLVTLRRGSPEGPPAGICQAPCTLEVEGGEYVVVVTGDGVRRGTRRISVGGDTTIQIRPGSTGLFVWGVVDLVLGPILDITGIVMLIASTGGNEAIAISGIIVGASGLVLTILGPIFIATSATRIKPLGGASFGFAPLPGGGGLGAVGFTF